MTRLTRRHGLQLGMGALAASTMLGGRGLRAAIPMADVAPPNLPIESGAALRVLRPSKFVQGDETLWMENTRKFTETTGVGVIVEQQGWEDLRPKTAVAANVGAGPDVILAWQEDPHLFADKLVPLDDVANYLGAKYGGWFPVAEVYGKRVGGGWIAMPVGGAGSTMVYRKSWVDEAGFSEFPTDFPGFLELAKALKANNRPMGFALGNAVGDGGWVDWVLWGHDSSLVDENNQVVIENENTKAALEYAKALADTFIPGVFAWLDPSNNKAFLAGEISCTNNGISIYYAAKNSEDPRIKEMAADIYHADYPTGPVGKPTQGALVINAMVMGYTRYPNAAKEYLRFMMEHPQYTAWQDASIGYWCHPLQAYDAADVWTVDPKHEPYKNVMRKALPQSYKGDPGEAAAAVKAEFVVLNMFQNYISGQMTAEQAMADAARRAGRYYHRS
jgi:multiple sugar transport system substrate-binding protein